jgi:transposase InsO family protein
MLSWRLQQETRRQQSVANTKTAIEEASQWADGLHTVVNRIGPRVPRAEPRQRVTAYVRRLLSPVECKNGWQLAEQAGDEPPEGMQRLLGCAVGWSMAKHMCAELVNLALSMATCQRRLAAGLIMHTDRGSQYGADSYRRTITPV